MNREDHMAWAKQRALAELDADPAGCGPVNALSSFFSDLGKHPDTAGHAGLTVTGMMMLSGALTSATQVREHIEGFR